MSDEEHEPITRAEAEDRIQALSFTCRWGGEAEIGEILYTLLEASESGKLASLAATVEAWSAENFPSEDGSDGYEMTVDD